MRAIWLTLAAAGLAAAQSKTLDQGPHRMEISVDRLDGKTWRQVDPGLVFAHDDRVRFRFRTNFEGYLYVMNHSTSGTYEQLFPRAETGRDNHVKPNREYVVPATDTLFRIVGPPGHEVVYWIVTPAELGDTQVPSLPREPSKPPTLIPRCDDSVLRARGECIDTSAGAKPVPHGAELPENLAGIQALDARDIVIMRQKNSTVIASPAPLSAPAIYEFRLAHR